MTHKVHEFDRYADVRAALADPALVPELPAADDGPPGASVSWLRATVARFCSGEPHHRRRALVEAELARLEPASLRQAVAAGPEADVRTRVVRTLAEALGMPQPGAVAQAVIVVAGAYFGGGDAAADEAVARLVARLAPDPADEAALEAAANRIGLLVQACDATTALVEAAADSGDVPLARVLREVPPVRTMRRIAARATHVSGREIAEADVVLLGLATANRTHPVPLAFGAPPRVCPGRRHALALADGLLRRPLPPFARLHHQATPLLLPNAWDYASAAALAAQGFQAIGTTSLGVAAALGLPDGAAATVDATVALARRLGQGSFLFTVDAEGGFSDDVEEVAELARKLYDAGAAGINLEDGRPDGTLAPVESHAAKISAVKAAVPALFVNARTDTHWLDLRQEETSTRLAIYEQAGADGVFVPGLSDPDGIAALTETLVTPLNILYSPTGPTLSRLAALGVRRVSLGSLPYRRALAAAVATATAVRDGQPTDLSAPSYAEVQRLGLPAGTPRRSAQLRGHVRVLPDGREMRGCENRP
ncbi:isocitrate lyase/phosphoenolpyruvate mutase family protein [Streptomyces phyllanthi]|uniref:Isocitrate lyase/phosphoenolpyruvate mutase family protein n=1 Tax=Streptomyces phyllanthi TaxID=1803180 RepID=A0A5N8VX22_9ACTN|nr:isocitrate lyase/phosphoenolpyruvate mutase family protein [Streptomyces phyllanthi]MPY39813.1 isocitrate lyase/phosphoenolpyruvate mutase family protein [Streptomyces phyllanthi]